jgi:transketolase N-terminal domain/subunit
MSAPRLGHPDHPLDNLTVIVDSNKIQLDDVVSKVLDRRRSRMEGPPAT